MCPDTKSKLEHASNVAQKFLEKLDAQVADNKNPNELKEMAEAAKAMGEALKILIEDIKECDITEIKIPSNK